MSDIRVSLIYLENLAARLDATAGALTNHTALGAYGLGCTPDLDAAYREFGGKWDERRGELAAALTCLADGFRSAAASFADTDQELATQVAGQGAR